MSKIQQVQSVMGPYLVFLFGKIEKISSIWDEGDAEGALGRAYRLFYFLPNGLKEKLKEDHKEILESFLGVRENRKIGWYSRKLDLNRRKRELANEILPGYIDEVMRFLDDRGYVEKASRPVPTNIDPSKFSDQF